MRTPVRELVRRALELAREELHPAVGGRALVAAGNGDVHALESARSFCLQLLENNQDRLEAPARLELQAATELLGYALNEVDSPASP